MSYDVSVEVIAVPDGVHDGKLRISLSVAPGRTGTGANADLTSWPTAISKLSKTTIIQLGALEGNEVRRIRGKRQSVAADLSGKTVHLKATETWKTIFDNPQALHKAVQGGVLGKHDDQQNSKAFMPKSLGSISTYLLATALEEIQLGLANAAISHRATGYDVRQDKAFWRQFDDITDLLLGDPVAQMSGLSSPAYNLLKTVRERRQFHADENGHRVSNGPLDLAKLNEAIAEAGASIRAGGKRGGAAAFRSPQSLLEMSEVKHAIVDLLLTLRMTDQRAGSANENKPVPKPQKDSEEQQAGRRLAALAAYPTLAKYFGLIVDLYVPLDFLPVGDHAFRVGFAGPDGSAPGFGQWTAYHRQGGYFGPLARSERAGGGTWSAAAAPLSRGLVVLGARMTAGGTAGRYELMQNEAVQNMVSLVGEAVAEREARRSGSRDHTGTPLTIPAREAGIALVDHRASETMRAKMHAAARFRHAVANANNVNFAEDLVRGYRVDACMTKSDSQSAEDALRWRPLMDRDITFEIDPAFLSDGTVRAVASRDEGLAQIGSVTSNGEAEIINQITMWRGEGLGVSPPDPACKAWPQEHDAGDELPITRTIGYAGDSARVPPPLRFGRGYWIGARACYVNGCGPTFAEARARYVVSTPGKPESLILGDGAEPFTYSATNALPPPVALLPADAQLVAAPTLPPGETAQQLVVKSSGETKRIEQRVLVPGRVAFDISEQFGQFDEDFYDNSVRPLGAFASRLRLERGLEGDFPVARRSGISAEPATTPPPPSAELPPALGTLAVFNSSTPVADREQYFPDPRARILGVNAALLNTTDSVERAEIAFWEEHARDASPIVLRLLNRAGPGGKDLALQHGTVAIPDAYGPDHLLNSLDVWLKPGRRAKLKLFGVEEAETAKRFDTVMHQVFRRHGRAFNRAIIRRENGVTQTAIELDLVHAVEKPLVAPDLLKIRAIVASMIEGKTGPEYPTASAEGGTTAFFEGRIAIDSPSTGRLRIDASWSDEGPEGLRQSQGKWRYAAPATDDRLIAFDHLDQISDTVVFGVPDTPRPAFSFKDGRARQLRLTPVATSAFTAFYGDGDPQRFERDAEENSTLTIPCTFRPPEPDHWQALPIPRWRSNRDGRRRYVFETWFDLRIYLGPNYMASGFGEQIGLVFWDGPADTSIEAYRAATEGHSSSLTQWGNDPIEVSAALPSTLPDITVFQDPESGTGLVKAKLPPLSDPGGEVSQGAIEPLPVIVLPMTSRVDPDEGPIVDIPIRKPRTYRPFVRLGLCRYQPHGLNDPKNGVDLRLSRSRPRTVTLFPPREGEVTVNERTVEVRLAGPGYRNRHVGASPHHVPTMRVRLMQYERPRLGDEPRPETHFRPVLDSVGKAIVREVPSSPGADSTAFYQTTLTLPHARIFRDYALIIEEIEFFVGDPTFDWAGYPDLASGGDGTSDPIISRLVFQRLVDIGVEAKDPDDLEPQFGHSRAGDRSYPFDRRPADEVADLAPVARAGLEKLLERFPGLEVVSGRRGTAAQARAMAQNVAIERSWLRRTYAASPQRAELLHWLEANEGASTLAVASAFAEIMDHWSREERSAFSRHFSGLAIDLRPVDDPAVERFIETLPGLRKFLRREGGLRRWHVEFEPSADNPVAGENLARAGGVDRGEP